MPNYGKKRTSILPKTGLTRVLLHDNSSQQNLLEVKLAHLNLEERRAKRLVDMHRKSFIVRQALKQQHLRQAGITHLSLMPDTVAEKHLIMAGHRVHPALLARKNERPLRRNSSFISCDYDQKSIEESIEQDEIDRVAMENTTVEETLKLPDIAARGADSQMKRLKSMDSPNTKEFSTYNFRRECTIANPGQPPSPSSSSSSSSPFA